MARQLLGNIAMVIWGWKAFCGTVRANGWVGGGLIVLAAAIFGLSVLAYLVFFACLIFNTLQQVLSPQTILRPDTAAAGLVRWLVSQGVLADWVLKPVQAPNMQLAFTVLGLTIAAPFIGWRYWLAHLQTQIAQENQVTGLFMSAIDRLGISVEDQSTSSTKYSNDYERHGAPSTPGADERSSIDQRKHQNRPVEARLGGVLALERLARRSSLDFDAIMDILLNVARSNMSDPDGLAAFSALARRYDSSNRAEPGKVQRMLVLDMPDAFNAPAHFSMGWMILRRMNMADWIYDDFSFVACTLQAADFRHMAADDVRTSKGVFKDCKLNHAQFDDATFCNVTIDSCDVQGVSFERAYFYGGNIQAVDLSNAKLDNCIFDGVDLSACPGLSKERLKAANVIIAPNTKLPDHIVWQPEPLYDDTVENARTIWLIATRKARLPLSFSA